MKRSPEEIGAAFVARSLKAKYGITTADPKPQKWHGFTPEELEPTMPRMRVRSRRSCGNEKTSIGKSAPEERQEPKDLTGETRR